MKEQRTLDTFLPLSDSHEGRPSLLLFRSISYANNGKTLKDFTVVARAEVRSLTALYIAVEKNADGLALYFGEDLTRCPFEQVITTLLNFVRMFRCAREENCKLDELEKKKALKEADTDTPSNPNSIKKHDRW